MHSEPKVLDVYFSSDWLEPMPVVTAKLTNGKLVTLFAYYPDIMSFEKDELVGLTLKEVNHLYFAKEKLYLDNKCELNCVA